MSARNGFDIKITGDKELMRALDQLEASVRKKALRRAVTAAVRPIRTAAKQRTPKRYGWLRKAMDSKIKSYKSGTVAGIIGARSDMEATITDRFGKTARIRPVKYLHLVEFGTSAHEIKMGRATMQHPGSRGYAMLRSAFDAHAPTAMQIIETKIREAIDAARPGGAR